MKKIEICKMEHGEAGEASKIVFASLGGNCAAFENYASAEAIASRLSFGHEVFFAKIDGSPAGVLEMRGSNHISMLFVAPDAVNNGVGTRLLSFAAARAKEGGAKQLTVHAAEQAIPFYVKRNFRARATASKQKIGGIAYTTLSFPLNGKVVLDRKLRGESVEFFVFSGTGNTYHIAGKLAEILREKNIPVNLRRMEKNIGCEIDKDSVVGLAFPVACFSTYPTVLNFINALPEGAGQKIFMIGTMGGAGLGMEGPLRDLLVKKGYSPIASKLFVMPGNYGSKEIPEEKNMARIEKSNAELPAFAASLCAGTEKWKRHWGHPFSKLLYKLGCSRRPWNTFYRMFPIQVNDKKCNVCGRCLRLCPTGALKMAGEFPKIDKKICQSCQRCVAFCPQHAIEIPNRPTAQYAFMSYDEFTKFDSQK